MVDFLKAVFVQGQLSRIELAHRAGQALEAKTYAQLTAVSAGITVREVAAAPSRQSAPARVRTRAGGVNRKAVAWALSLIVVLPGLGYAFFATYYGSFFILLRLAFIAAGCLGSTDSPGANRYRAY